MLTSVGLAWHHRFFKDLHFIGPLEVEADGLPKAPAVHNNNNNNNNNNLISIILYHDFPLNVYEYPKDQ